MYQRNKKIIQHFGGFSDMKIQMLFGQNVAKRRPTNFNKVKPFIFQWTKMEYGAMNFLVNMLSFQAMFVELWIYYWANPKWCHVTKSPLETKHIEKKQHPMKIPWDSGFILQKK